MKKTLYKITIISLMLFLLSCKTQDEVTSINEKYAQSIFESAQNAWPQLNKAWENNLYQQLRLIVADKESAWAIDDSSIIKIPYEEITKRNLPVEYFHYQQIEWSDKRPTLYMSLGEVLPAAEKARFQAGGVPEIFYGAVHEAFHIFVHEEWKLPATTDNSRATVYPASFTPRFYRNSIIRALSSTIQGDSNGLGHARYWFERWKKEYSNETSRINATDVIEGSAKYIEAISEICAQGIYFDSQQYHHAFRKKLKEEASFIDATVDGESYTIGMLAGYLLDQQNKEWKSLLEQGITPLDMLLSDVPAVYQTADETSKQIIKEKVNKENALLAPVIERFIKDYHTAGITKIFIDDSNIGSFRMEQGVYRTDKIPHDLLVGFYLHKSWSGSSIEFNNIVAIAIEASPLYGNRGGYLILYPGESPENNNGRLILKTPAISLNIPYPANPDATGLININPL